MSAAKKTPTAGSANARPKKRAAQVPQKRNEKSSTSTTTKPKSGATARSGERATFLIKSEPFKYSWEALLRDERTVWDGVRNFEARNHLRSMRVGDLCLFYHSNEGKEVVGVAKVVREAYPDPTADDGDWSVVDVAPAFSLNAPVTLETMRETKELAEIRVVTRPRLSVMPVTKQEFDTVLRLGKTKMPKDG